MLNPSFNAMQRGQNVCLSIFRPSIKATAKLPPIHFLILSAYAVTGRPFPLHPFIVP